MMKGMKILEFEGDKYGVNYDMPKDHSLDLRACPFCFSPVGLELGHTHSPFFRVTCTNCDTDGPRCGPSEAHPIEPPYENREACLHAFISAAENAISAWNTVDRSGNQGKFLDHVRDAYTHSQDDYNSALARLEEDKESWREQVNLFIGSLVKDRHEVTTQLTRNGGQVNQLGQRWRWTHYDSGTMIMFLQHPLIGTIKATTQSTDLLPTAREIEGLITEITVARGAALRGVSDPAEQLALQSQFESKTWAQVVGACKGPLTSVLEIIRSITQENTWFLELLLIVEERKGHRQAIRGQIQRLRRILPASEAQLK